MYILFSHCDFVIGCRLSGETASEVGGGESFLLAVRDAHYTRDLEVVINAPHRRAVNRRAENCNQRGRSMYNENVKWVLNERRSSPRPLCPLLMLLIRASRFRELKPLRRYPRGGNNSSFGYALHPCTLRKIFVPRYSVNGKFRRFIARRRTQPGA